ncbi:hypothetical protein PILCRDRAFT_316802 [Piloderma croceum F 1598]|uniref:Uncharacterized protein n=1 Tax=Piloderma croceum (strain F 1598) TaxID=765440 RepID=A0A0C3G817_PILCF|nr:hypothetical protein PILCRDRAFT_316802 [Piloderma croceum F 1598]
MHPDDVGGMDIVPRALGCIGNPIRAAHTCSTAELPNFWLRSPRTLIHIRAPVRHRALWPRKAFCATADHLRGLAVRFLCRRAPSGFLLWSTMSPSLNGSCVTLLCPRPSTAFHHLWPLLLGGPEVLFRPARLLLSSTFSKSVAL